MYRTAVRSSALVTIIFNHKTTFYNNIDILRKYSEYLKMYHDKIIIFAFSIIILRVLHFGRYWRLIKTSFVVLEFSYTINNRST